MAGDLRERMVFRLTVIGAALAVCIIVAAYAILSGTIAFTLPEVTAVLMGHSEYGLANQIIRNVRLPRMLTGMLVGMNLAVAGGLLQGILRNPMASPNIIGVNSGAGLAAVMIMVLFPGKMQLIPIAAFTGAMLAALTVYLLSMKSSTGSATVHIVLAGVALSSLFSAFTSGIMMLHSDELEITYTWLLGSLSGRGWPFFTSLLPYSIVGLGMAVFLSPKVNIFGLGDEMGKSIGIPIGFYRIVIIITAATLAGSAVSVAGTIGFIGLIGPHMARLLVGNDYRYLTPLSALLGGALLVFADTVARTAFQPFELSVGVGTSILGAPFFLWLLHGKRSRHNL